MDPSLVSLSIYDGDSSVQELDQTPKPEKKDSFKRPDDSSDHPESEHPIIYGDFTNWKGVKMMPVDEFVLILAKKYGR